MLRTRRRAVGGGEGWELVGGGAYAPIDLTTKATAWNNEGTYLHPTWQRQRVSMTNVSNFMHKVGDCVTTFSSPGTSLYAASRSGQVSRILHSRTGGDRLRGEEKRISKTYMDRWCLW